MITEGALISKWIKIMYFICILHISKGTNTLKYVIYQNMVPCIQYV